MFLRNVPEAMFIPGATSIPEARVCQELQNFMADSEYLGEINTKTNIPKNNKFYNGEKIYRFTSNFGLYQRGFDSGDPTRVSI